MKKSKIKELIHRIKELSDKLDYVIENRVDTTVRTENMARYKSAPLGSCIFSYSTGELGSSKRIEPVHVHVKASSGRSAKYWLNYEGTFQIAPDPASPMRLKDGERSKIEDHITKNQELFIEEWITDIYKNDLQNNQSPMDLSTPEYKKIEESVKKKFKT